MSGMICPSLNLSFDLTHGSNVYILCMTGTHHDIPRQIVRAAVEAACKETGARPEDVLAFKTDAPGQPQYKQHPISRARAYAVVALRAHCEGVSQHTICFACGARDTWLLKALDTRRNDGLLQWWSDDVFMRVVQAVDKAENLNELPGKV